jgi:sugar phosphate permease
MAGVLSAEQKAWRWRVLTATYMGYAGYYLTRRVFTIAKPTLHQDFGWDYQMIGHIWTAYLIAYMIGQFLNSYLGRKWGPRTILLGGLAISMACNIAFGIANSYAMFLVFMIVNGLVQASGWPGVVGSVSKWLRASERGFVMGIWSTSYQLGSILVKTFGALLLSYGWRQAFFGCTLATLGIWWLLYIWQRDDPESAGVPPIPDAMAEQGRAVKASDKTRVNFLEYLRVVFSPIVLVMGASYFCIKFLRYALDSWLPAFLTIQGLDPSHAAFYSNTFDFAGLAGAIIAGYLLDKVFRGNWAILCLMMTVGMIGGYLMVMYFGTNPASIALCYGIVGIMIFGPDTLLCGAASVEVAGKSNAVAVAGIVNGIGSIGPVVQEEVIGSLMGGDMSVAFRNTNVLYLSMSITFGIFMMIIAWQLHKVRRRAPVEQAQPAIAD